MSAIEPRWLRRNVPFQAKRGHRPEADTAAGNRKSARVNDCRAPQQPTQRGKNTRQHAEGLLEAAPTGVSELHWRRAAGTAHTISPVNDTLDPGSEAPARWSARSPRGQPTV